MVYINLFQISYFYILVKISWKSEEQANSENLCPPPLLFII